MRKYLLTCVALLFAVSAPAQPLPPPPASPAHPGYVVNNWYLPTGEGHIAAAGFVAQTANRTVCTYGGIAQTMTITGLGGNIGTVAVGNTQWAIYNNGGWGRPSTLVVASPSVSTNGSNFQSATISQQLPAGNYWWCQNTDNSTVIFNTFYGGTTENASLVGGAGANIINTANSPVGVFVAQTFGTWPDFNSGTAWSAATGTSVAMIAFKVGSVP